MSFVKETLEAIERGREGLNTGIPFSLPRLSEELCGIQRHESYLIGAPTGTGKSTLLDLFVYDAFDYYLENKDNMVLHIDYFSFEMEKTNIIVKGILRKLYRDFGIILPRGLNEILSRGKNRISDETYDKVKEVMSYFEELEDVLHLYDTADNPTGIWRKSMENVNRLGKTEREAVVDSEGNHKTTEKGKPMYRRVKYTPHHPKTYHIIAVDHIALAATERGYTKKQNIDKTSEYLLDLRKFYGCTPFVVQQLNYDIDSPDRIKTGRLTPMLSDFGDSKYTTRDFPNVISLFNPADKDITAWKGLDLKAFQGNFVIADLLKCRYGRNNLQYPLWFKGPSSTFKELPKISELQNTEVLEEIRNQVNHYYATQRKKEGN